MARAQIPAPTLQLLTAYHYSSSGFDAPFWPLRQICTCGAQTHTQAKYSQTSIKANLFKGVCYEMSHKAVTSAPYIFIHTHK